MSMQTVKLPDVVMCAECHIPSSTGGRLVVAGGTRPLKVTLLNCQTGLSQVSSYIQVYGSSVYVTSREQI